MALQSRPAMLAVAGALVGFVLTQSAPAEAGVWRWGCMGALGDRQIAFNRDGLIVVTGQATLGNLESLVHRDDPADIPSLKVAAPMVARYQAEGDGGLEPSMTFAAGDGHKVTLTEQSSKLSSRRARLVDGCRDETTERFQKTYRVEIGKEAPQTTSLVCMVYELSTTGGRKCR